MNIASRNLRPFGDLGPRQRLHLFIVFSLLIHLFSLSLSLILLNKDDHPVMPSPYVVNLVSPEVLPEIGEGKEKGELSDKARAPKTQAEVAKTRVEGEKHAKEKGDSFKKDEEFISERIDAIRAKKRIERIAGLRNTISLQARGDSTISRSPEQQNKGVSGGKGRTLVDDYYSRITSEIWQHWIYPDLGGQVMEAIVVIKIMKDGSVQIKGVEKTSGNSLFDRSAIRAITKASPLPPPPYEMEIGVRFYP